MYLLTGCTSRTVSLCVAVVHEALEGGHELSLRESLFVLPMAIVDVIGLQVKTQNKTE